MLLYVKHSKKSYVHKHLHDSFSKKTKQEYSRDRSVRKVPNVEI